MAEAPVAADFRDRVVLTRVFDAPRELVFRMWSDPGHFAQWYGPAGFTVPNCEIDLRPGGVFRVEMRAPNGSVYPMVGTFTEVLVPERLVFGTRVGDSEDLTTVIFADEGGKTRLTLTTGFTRVAAEHAQRALANMEKGWTETLGRLAGHLASLGNP